MRKFTIKGMLLLVVLLGYLTGKISASPPLKTVTTNDWKDVIEAIAEVESTHNPKAIGKNGSVGLLQITPILVKECNNILRTKKLNKKYTLKDRLDPIKSIEMFHLYQEKYNPEKNVEKAIRLWNGGPKYSIKKTQRYFKKVLSKLS